MSEGWVTAKVKCRICGHEHITVYPVDILDEDAQECSKCHHMTCEPVTDGDGDGDEEEE